MFAPSGFCESHDAREMAKQEADVEGSITVATLGGWSSQTLVRTERKVRTHEKSGTPRFTQRRKRCSRRKHLLGAHGKTGKSSTKRHGWPATEHFREPQATMLVQMVTMQERVVELAAAEKGTASENHHRVNFRCSPVGLTDVRCWTCCWWRHRVKVADAATHPSSEKYEKYVWVGSGGASCCSLCEG